MDMQTFEITTDDLRVFLVHVTRPYGRKMWTWAIEERVGLAMTKFRQQHWSSRHRGGFREPDDAFGDACRVLWHRAQDDLTG